jgi:mRNA-degrading endonuclease RelE of RelBE toxin-antitoxin system
MKRLDYSNQAKKFLKYSESRVQVRLNPYLFGSIKLKGDSFCENSYRVRLGNYRIIYTFNAEEDSILIFRIESRGNVYTVREKEEYS